MKLLLLTVVSYIAQGTCLAGSATNGATNSAAANVVCTGACAAAITATAANAAAATLRKCADGYTGTPEAAVCPGDGTSATDATGGLAWSGCTVIACTPNTSTATGCKTCILIADRTAGADQCLTCNAGSFLAAKACTACTKPTGTTTATCTAATDLTTVDCGAAYYETPAVTGVDAVTRVCLPEATGATTSTPGVAGVTFVTASCTACAGEQTGCATGASTATTCSTGAAIQNLQCTRTSTGYSLTGSLVTKCATAGVATYTVGTAAISGDCTTLTCSTGYTASGAAGSIVCTANACTATAVTAGYAATGLPLVTGVDFAAATGSASACPATTVVAMVPMVTARLAADVVLPEAALNVADVGTVTCATGYTGAAAAATCPTAAGPIVYTGCTKDAAAPASAAQTMIACVLAVVAMYL